MEQVLELESVRKTQALFIKELKTDIARLEAEAQEAREKAAASMLSDSTWRVRYTALYEKYKESRAEAARLLHVDADLAVAMQDISVFCKEIVSLKWELGALTNQLAQTSEALSDCNRCKQYLEDKTRRRRREIRSAYAREKRRRRLAALTAWMLGAALRRDRRKRRAAVAPSLSRRKRLRCLHAWRDVWLHWRRAARGRRAAGLAAGSRFRHLVRGLWQGWSAASVFSGARRRRGGLAAMRMQRSRCLAALRSVLEAWWWYQALRRRGRRLSVAQSAATACHTPRLPLHSLFFLEWAREVRGQLVGAARGQLADALAARDTAVIDLSLAKAHMLHTENKMGEELEKTRRLLEAQGNKLLVASRASRDSERLRGKLAASLRLSHELHSQVQSERAREHLLPNCEKPSRACGGGEQLQERRGSDGAVSLLAPTPASNAEAVAARTGSGGQGGEAPAEARLDWILESRERDLERVSLLRNRLPVHPRGC